MALENISARRLSTILAYGIAGVLTIAGGVSVHILVHEWSVSAPLVIFYVLLVVNTFFSIRYFHSFEPARSASQWFLNIVLFIQYLGLTLSFGDPLQFIIVLGSMFALATLKYVFLRRAIGPDPTIARKIRIDGLTTVAILVAIVGAVFGAVQIVVWTLAIGNGVANIILLWVHPLYTRQSAS